MKPKSPKPIRGYGYLRPNGSLSSIFGWCRASALLDLTSSSNKPDARERWSSYFKKTGWKPVRVTLSLSLDTK